LSLDVGEEIAVAFNALSLVFRPAGPVGTKREREMRRSTSVCASTNEKAEGTCTVSKACTRSKDHRPVAECNGCGEIPELNRKRKSPGAKPAAATESTEPAETSTETTNNETGTEGSPAPAETTAEETAAAEIEVFSTEMMASVNVGDRVAVGSVSDDFLRETFPGRDFPMLTSSGGCQVFCGLFIGARFRQMVTCDNRLAAVEAAAVALVTSPGRTVERFGILPLQKQPVAEFFESRLHYLASECGMNITNQEAFPPGSNVFVISEARLKAVSETISTELSTNPVFKSATYIESVADSDESETPHRRSRKPPANQSSAEPMEVKGLYKCAKTGCRIRTPQPQPFSCADSECSRKSYHSNCCPIGSIVLDGEFFCCSSARCRKNSAVAEPKPISNNSVLPQKESSSSFAYHHSTAMSPPLRDLSAQHKFQLDIMAQSEQRRVDDVKRGDERAREERKFALDLVKAMQPQSQRRDPDRRDRSRSRERDSESRYHTGSSHDYGY
jgi:hypothetical protein